MTIALDLNSQVKFMVGIFAILNPVGAIPIFLSMAAEKSAQEMHRIAMKAAIAVTTILIVSVWIGDALLIFFGIGLPAFRIAGGLLVLMIAIAMFHAKTSPASHTDAEKREAESKTDIAVVPLAIPLMAGPGAISLVIVDAHQATNLIDKILLSGVIAAIGIIVWLVLRMAGPIGDKLGTTGLNIGTRIMGLLLAAMAVQFIVDGLIVLLPGLTH